MKTDMYKKFSKVELNNARLLLYKTYMQDLSDFQTLYELTGENFTEFLHCCKTLKKSDKPEQGLKIIITDLQNSKFNQCRP